MRHDTQEMREWRSRWSVLAVILLVTAIAGAPMLADAAASVVAPSRWGESATAAPEAQRRASRWQTALGLRLAQVVSAPQDDRFAETVAVFEVSEPVAERTFADEATAIDALAAAVVHVVGDAPPEAAELRETATGESLVWARWTVDDLSYECALAPSGDTTTLVIAAVLASEAEVHRTTLSQVFAGLEGVTPPMPRFSLLGWRLGAVLMWLALALGLHAAMLPLGDRDHDHGQAGARASGINLVLVVIGTVVAATILRGRELELVYAGSSVAGLSVWIGVVGISVVGLHFLLASRYDRGQVRSAPSTGTFASGTYAAADVLRPSISRSGMYRIPDDFESSSSWPVPGASQSQRIVVDDEERE